MEGGEEAAFTADLPPVGEEEVQGDMPLTAEGVQVSETAPLAGGFTPTDCMNWIGGMRLRAYLPLLVAFGLVVAQASMLTRRESRGLLWISVFSSLALALFLLSMLMAAQFAGANPLVIGAIGIALVALAANVVINFFALAKRSGLALDADYQLASTIVLGAILVISGLGFAMGYSNVFTQAQMTLQMLERDQWQSETTPADALSATLAKMNNYAIRKRLTGAVDVSQATPETLLALGDAARGQAQTRRTMSALRPQLPRLRRPAMPAMPSWLASRRTRQVVPEMPAAGAPEGQEGQEAMPVRPAPEADEGMAAAAQLGDTE
jgi:hypothetical protein